MRHTSFGLCVVVLAAVSMYVALPSAAQEKSARGSVTAIGPNSITVKAGTSEMVFTVDEKTVLTASGAGTAERRAEATGKPGPKVADFVKVGDAVDVSYHEMGGALHASDIRRIRSAGPGGGSTSDDKTETSNGTVQSLTGTMLTIGGSTGGGGTFTQSFMVDGNTKVVAVGAGTAADRQGGKVPLADFVGAGDQVTVSYMKMGSSLHATEIRVREKKR